MKIKQKNTIDMTHGTLWNKLLILLCLWLPVASYSNYLILWIPQWSAVLQAAVHWRPWEATVRSSH